LYTSLEHEDIKFALSSVVRLAFKHSKKGYISIYNYSSSFVKSTREGTWYFDCESLITAINYLLDNCYFTIGDVIFKQIIGVPMGVDPGPYMANLTLWFYENRYLEYLYKVDYFSAKLLNKTYRLIDDITSINSDGVFGNHTSNIYPGSLVLNKENKGDIEANVLDLSISLEKGLVDIDLYDKRDNFPFDIVQFVPANTNVSRNVIYGVFGTQVIRYFRIINNCDKFIDRVQILANNLKNIGYDCRLLKNTYSRVYKKYKFRDRFGLKVKPEYIF